MSKRQRVGEKSQSNGDQVIPKEKEEVEDEVAELVLKINELESHGFSVADIRKLKDANYHTVESVAMTMKRNLLKIRGFSDVKVDKLQSVASKLVKNMGFTTGFEIEQEQNTLFKLTTGSKELDKLLGGGIEAGSITEVFGEFGSGKSQLCHTLAVTCQLSKNVGGAAGKCIYIDTEKTFKAQRVREIAERFGLDGNVVLNNIIYAKAYNTDNQVQLVMQAQSICMEDTVSLIIVDSAMALYRVDFAGRGELSDRQIHLGQFMSRLNNLADMFKIAVVITNQVTSDPGAMNMFAMDKPIGGNIMAHSSSTRLSLRKAKDSARKCVIYDSTTLPKSDCLFEITKGGIDDVQ